MSPYVVPDRAQPGRKLPTPLTPTFWAALTIIPFDDLRVDTPQCKPIPGGDVPAELLSSSEESTNTSTQQSKLANPPPLPHEYYFFDDGNITFLIEGILYRVHQYFFCRDSNEFKDRLSRIPTQQELSSSVIHLDGVRSVDFDSFLSVLYPLNFNKLEERSFEEWSSILDLSTRWGFTSIRDLALRCVKPPNPLQRLILARKYAVEKWVVPALLELCERPEPLSLDEARLMDLEDVVLVGSVRHTVRSSALMVNGAGIRECIRAWRSGKPLGSVSNLPCEYGVDCPVAEEPYEPACGRPHPVTPVATKDACEPTFPAEKVHYGPAPVKGEPWPAFPDEKEHCEPAPVEEEPCDSDSESPFGWISRATPATVPDQHEPACAGGRGRPVTQVKADPRGASGWPRGKTVPAKADSRAVFDWGKAVPAKTDPREAPGWDKFFQSQRMPLARRRGGETDG